MKKVKLNLFLLLTTLALMTTSCYQEDFYDEFDDQNEWSDDDANFEDGDNDSDFDDNEGGESHDDHDHSGGTATLTSYKIIGESIVKIKDFEVGGNMLAFQQDIAKHQAMFEYYTRIIPVENRQKITEFVVFHGQGELFGYVEPIDHNDLSKWRMGLAIDQASDIDDIDFGNEFAYTVVHEFGHVLTLNNEQIAVGGNENSCPNFHTGEGCSNANSYINALYELGWADIYDEFAQSGGDGYAIYDKYPDRFVTEYAATNPGEDIAEVFTVFVIQEQMPTGNTIANKKVRMMYDYPELVQLRNQIRQDPSLRGIVPGSWVTQHAKLRSNYKLKMR